MAFRLKLGADGRVYGNPEHHFGNIFVSLKTEKVKTVSRREQRKKRMRDKPPGNGVSAAGRNCLFCSNLRNLFPLLQCVTDHKGSKA